MMLAHLGVEMTEVEVSRVLGVQEFGAPRSMLKNPLSKKLVRAAAPLWDSNACGIGKEVAILHILSDSRPTPKF